MKERLNRRAILIILAVLALLAVVVAALILNRQIGTTVGGGADKVLIGSEFYQRVGLPGTHAPDDPMKRGRLLGTVADGEDRLRVYAVKGTDRYIDIEGTSGGALYERLESLPDTAEEH